jgi:hypothetical protein
MIALLGLGLLALGLTIAMFATRNMMLGFPSAIFWGILGGYAYQQSSVTGDWLYLLFFGSMGMVIFCIFAAYTLRRSDLAGPDMDKGEFIDEGGRRKSPRQLRQKALTSAAPDEDENGWGDIDRLGMHDTGDRAAPSSHRTRELRDQVGKRRRGLRKRAEKRQTGVIDKPARWGEFK